MSEWLRLHVAQVLAKHEESGIPFEMLIGGTPPECSSQTWSCTSQCGGPNRRRGDARRSPCHRSSSCLLTSPPRSPSAITTSPRARVFHSRCLPSESTACAAEPPPFRRITWSTHRASIRDQSRCSRESKRGTTSEELVDQLRQTCDEIRVLWQAVDELRESLEHALRNQPELRRACRAYQPDPVVDSNLDDFLERTPAVAPSTSGESPAATRNARTAAAGTSAGAAVATASRIGRRPAAPR
jgi:hypothetical protein